MNWFAKAWGVLFGGSGGGIVAPIAAVYKAKAEASGQEAQAATDDVVSARQFAAPGSGQGVFNDLVDAANRLVRPVVSFYLLGGFAGWWKFPDLKSFDPAWIAAGSIVLTFWFGGRLLTKDLPAGLAKAIAIYFSSRR